MTPTSTNPRVPLSPGKFSIHRLARYSMKQLVSHSHPPRFLSYLLVCYCTPPSPWHVLLRSTLTRLSSRLCLPRTLGLKESLGSLTARLKSESGAEYAFYDCSVSLWNTFLRGLEGVPFSTDESIPYVSGT